MDESLLNDLLERERNRVLEYFNGAAKGSEALKARVGEQLSMALSIQTTKIRNDNERKLVIERERIETAKRRAIEVCTDHRSHS